MKRKVVKHGPSSLTVSLPIKWVKKNNIKGGDEIDVQEKDKELILSGKGRREEKEISIDIYSKNLIKRILIMPYTRGYDIIRVNFDSHKALEFIQQNIDLLFGFEIIDQKPNYCRLKNMTEPKTEEFECMLLRMFNVCLSMLEDLKEFIQKDSEEALRRIPFTKRTMTRLDLYCRRMINMGDWGSETRKAGSTYAIIRSIEEIGDIVTFVSANVTRISDKHRSEFNSLVKNLIKSFIILRKIKYKGKVDLIYEYKTIEDELWRARKKKHKFVGEELELFFLLDHIQYQIHEMSEEVILWIK